MFYFRLCDNLPPTYTRWKWCIFYPSSSISDCNLWYIYTYMWLYYFICEVTSLHTCLSKIMSLSDQWQCTVSWSSASWPTPHLSLSDTEAGAAATRLPGWPLNLASLTWPEGDSLWTLWPSIWRWDLHHNLTWWHLCSTRPNHGCQLCKGTVS